MYFVFAVIHSTLILFDWNASVETCWLETDDLSNRLLAVLSMYCLLRKIDFTGDQSSFKKSLMIYLKKGEPVKDLRPFMGCLVEQARFLRCSK